MNNKKLLVIGLVIVSICWIGNIYYYFENRLDGFIFMDNYKEIGVNVYEVNEENIEEDINNMSQEEKEKYLINIYVEELLLPYISDVRNNEQITEIVFPELDNMVLYNYSESMWNNPYIHGNLKSNYIGWNSDRLSYEDKQAILERVGKEPITNAIFKTNLGKSYNVDLGEIYLVEISRNIDSILEYANSSSNSDGDGYSTLKARKDVNIVAIESNVLDEVKEIYDIYINDEHIDNVKFPIHIAKDKELEVKYQQKGNKVKSFEFNLMIKVESEDAKEYVRLPMALNNHYGLSDDIIKNIKEDGNIAYEISDK